MQTTFNFLSYNSRSRVRRLLAAWWLEPLFFGLSGRSWLSASQGYVRSDIGCQTDSGVTTDQNRRAPI
jgi:hypothetical protein